LHRASNIVIFSIVSAKEKPKRRSGCPVGISLDLVGDRWSLLIVRDLMVRGMRTFKDFQQAGEGIATNVLADRLRKLEAAGVISAQPEPADRRKVQYRLTEKGIDLAPVLTELLLWGARYENTATPPELIAQLEVDRQGFLAEVRRRWKLNDTTPLIPRFQPRAGKEKKT
jgi:DNA-binding HxlR family transcriptional regulator